MTFGILGSGSWGTALAKILTDNGHTIHWWNRSQTVIEYILNRHHNPHYLSAAHFNITKLHLSTNPVEIIQSNDIVIIAVPSAFTHQALEGLDKNIFTGKKVVSAVKGVLPGKNELLNEYLYHSFNIELKDYFAILGPCHAEEVVAEKLSYLTFSGIDAFTTSKIAEYFKTPYLNTVENTDIYGVQFAAVLKNIYAIGSGIAHGLDYGDNFLSVFIANSASEMEGFLRKAGEQYLQQAMETPNYAASVYLGDLLVTCYSLHSRNRSFGNMIGKGYAVKTASLEMNMVAEGYNASRCMHIINQTIRANMPIAETIYKILWENLPAREGFNIIEKILV